MPAARYSEDIDLVQTVPENIGATLDALRVQLDPWLGAPKREFSAGRVTLVWRTLSEGEPPVKLRVKVEINSREHFTVFGLQNVRFTVTSRWFTGAADLVHRELITRLTGDAWRTDANPWAPR